MKNIKLAIALALLIGLGTNKVIAQIDPHFSQYYANPLWLNPALTGVIDGEYRANINAKQQWANIDNGYLTAGASFDTAPTNKFAFGGMIINQRAGAVSFNQLNALASAAYRIKLGKNGDQIINFGVQAGIISKSLNTSKITLGSQYDPTMGYNGGMPFNETIAAENFLAPDINAGVMFFDAGAQKAVNLFAGAAVAHINRPLDKFIGGDSRLPMRFTAHGGARVKVNHLIDITPNVLYLKQGVADQVALGAYAQLMLNAESDLIFGSNYRFNDAAIAFLGLHVKSMVFGLSYDFNTSGLNKSTGSRGGLELSISFTGRRGIIGPNFFCPRL